MGFASLYPSYALWATTMDKLAVDQPNYASYKRELGRNP